MMVKIRNVEFHNPFVTKRHYVGQFKTHDVRGTVGNEKSILLLFKFEETTLES
jgi:hypothetical protein